MLLLLFLSSILQISIILGAPPSAGVQNLADTAFWLFYKVG